MSRPDNIPEECWNCQNRVDNVCVGFEGIISQDLLVLCHRYAFHSCPQCDSWSVKKINLGDGIGKYCMNCKEIVAAWKEDHWPAIPFGDPEEELDSDASIKEITLKEAKG